MAKETIATASKETRKLWKEKADKTKQYNKMIKNVVYEEIKNLILSGKRDSTYYGEFMKKFFDVAKKQPNSKAGILVASTILNETLIDRLDEEHEKQMQKEKDFQRFTLIKDFFKEQRQVIYETNHAKNILACCSRRAGKTDLASGAICYAAIIPESRIIYINLTFSNAIRQIWDNVVTRSSMAGLQISSSSKSEGTIEFSNGSSLRIMGNSNNSEIDKLRGESHVSLVVVDEFFHQRNMNYAILDVISPLLADRRDSSLICMGTPPRVAHSYGEKCWNEGGWIKFHWTMFENPYIPAPKQYLEEMCASKGISIDSPFVQREFFGKIGVYDTEAMVFRGRTTYDQWLNEEKITDISIGVDYGFSDFNSIITLAYNRHTKHSWVVLESKFNRAGVSEIIAEIQKHYEYAKKLCCKNLIVISEHVKIYCDTNEESITYDLMLKYKLPAYNCYKYDKAYAIEMLSEELRTGRMSIPRGGILDDEMEQILYKRDEDTDTIIPVIDEDIGIHPDATMALLYASRKAFFDMDYDIDFRQSRPKLSNFKKDGGGTIIDVNTEDNDSFGEGGVIG